MGQRVRQAAAGLLRMVLSWPSLLAIPAGIVLGLSGSMTLGALLVLGGTAAYFLVDPILMLLDLRPPDQAEAGRGRWRHDS